MSESYDAKLCEEKHKNIDKALDEHENRLNSHSNRLDKLEQRGARVDEKLENLIDRVDGLIGTLRWVIALMVPTLISLIGLFFKNK